MDAQDAFKKFMSASQIPPHSEVTLAFFVGYSQAATGVMENIEALIEAFKKSGAPSDAALKEGE